MTDVRIYRPVKSAMQSGRANLDTWVIEFETGDARRLDPLMGWVSSGDMRGQVRLKFPSLDGAIAYAQETRTHLPGPGAQGKTHQAEGLRR